MISRRNFLKGAGGILVAAPFVVKSGILMPVKKKKIIHQWITGFDLARPLAECCVQAKWVPYEADKDHGYFLVENISGSDITIKNINVQVV